MNNRRVEYNLLTLIFILTQAAASHFLLADGQVAGLQVHHHRGQTFLTWREVDPPDLKDGVDVPTLKKTRQNLEKTDKIRYCIYRSEKPITSLQNLTPLAQVGPLSCWNLDYYGIYPKPGQTALRYVIRDDAEPLTAGTGLYVHNPHYPTDGKSRASSESGKSYYAVTYSKGAKENTSLTAANSISKPVREITGPGVPVLQRIEKPKEFAYIKNPVLHYYVRWEAPPNAAVENKPFDYLVAIPPSIEQTPTPVGLHLHCWGGSLDGGYGWWYHYNKLGTTYLISSNQIPYDWWTGYHEFFYSRDTSEAKWKQGVVKPYSTTRMLSFLDWAAGIYQLDLNQVFTAGSSMGGSGAPMFAIRHADRIAWSIGWVGVHDPGNTPQFTGSYERVYGKKEWNINFEDGTPAFEYYKDAAYLRKYPNEEVGFITFSNGKNDGGIGWPQAVEFFQALQETRRPHLFVWGLSGHGQRAVMPAGGGQRVMPISIRLDQNLPAFTHCSLDDDPGTARKLEVPKKVTVGKESRTDNFDGDSTGQVNRYLYWETDNIVDTAERWEITVALTNDAPEEKCTVDITPRRLLHLRPKAGEEFRWNNSLEGKTIQSGTVRADRWSLVTVPKVVVTKKKNRIVISK